MIRNSRDEYIRSGVFGFEDAIISTTGLVIGLSSSTQNKDFILLACFVAIAVAALSASSSELISDETVNEIEKTKSQINPVMSAGIMFLAYLLGGIIPALPIFIFDFPQSIIGTVVFSIFGFIVLGFIKARFTKGSATKSILQILLIGGASAIIGISVGYFLKI